MFTMEDQKSVNIHLIGTLYNKAIALFCASQFVNPLRIFSLLTLRLLA